MTGESPPKFWGNIFSNLGFEKTSLADRIAFKIPVHDAMCLCQIVGSTEWKTKKNSRGEAFVFLEDGQILMFPNPCPTVLIREVTTKIKYRGSYESKINPLLSLSLKFIREQHPEFFDKNFKYLMFDLGSGAVKDIAKVENLKTSDIVSLSLPTNRKDVNEPLLTYIFCAFLRKRGFIVDEFNGDSWVGADMYAFKIPELQNRLIELGVVEGGSYLNELELINNIKKTSQSKIRETKSVTIEVEAPTLKDTSRYGKGRTQLLKQPGYLSPSGTFAENYFTEGYVAIPSIGDTIEKKAKTAGGTPAELGFNPEEEIGIITIDRQGNFLFKECPKHYGNQEDVSDLLKDVERIIKLALLKNLSLKQTFNLLPDARSFYDLFYSVDKLDIDKIVDAVRR